MTEGAVLMGTVNNAMWRDVTEKPLPKLRFVQRHFAGCTVQNAPTLAPGLCDCHAPRILQQMWLVTTSGPNASLTEHAWRDIPLVEELAA